MAEDRGKLIQHTSSGRTVYPIKDKGPSGKKITLSIIIGVIIFIIIIIIIGYSVIKNLGGPEASNNNIGALNQVANSADNANNNTNINIDSNINGNTNTAPSLKVNQEITVQGRVFIKGYDTPSESYGILTTEGNEIGLEKYDSTKEQFRPYINENITVTFSSVCRTTSSDCCLTLFYYCGTIKSWEPLEE